jgi:hypothetical protein
MNTHAPDHDEAADYAWDENLRTNQIIWLAGEVQGNGDKLQDIAEEGDVLPDTLGDAFQKFFDEADSDLEEFIGFCVRQKKLGFLVEVATPVPEYHRGGGSFGYSWGFTYTKWFYTERLDLAFFERVNREWKQVIHEEAKREVKEAA